MTIERTQPSQHTEASERSDATKEARNDKRPPPLRENVDRFRTLMQQRGEGENTGKTDSSSTAKGGMAKAAAGEHATVAQPGKAVEAVEGDLLRRSRDEKGLSSSALQAADASAMFQAQVAVRDGISQAPTAPVNPNAFADMVERHVRQLAIGRDSTPAGDGQVLLRMSDATLPGTDLLLSRTADGWMLRADSRSRSSHDAIKDAAPALAKRFAERDLGTLSIDPHFHG